MIRRRAPGGLLAGLEYCTALPHGVLLGLKYRLSLAACAGSRRGATNWGALTCAPAGSTRGFPAAPDHSPSTVARGPIRLRTSRSCVIPSASTDRQPWSSRSPLMSLGSRSRAPARATPPTGGTCAIGSHSTIGAGVEGRRGPAEGRSRQARGVVRRARASCRPLAGPGSVTQRSISQAAAARANGSPNGPHQPSQHGCQ